MRRVHKNRVSAGHFWSVSRNQSLSGLSGQDRDFTDLWRTFAPRVMVYARRHVAPADAEEIVAETFVVAWRRHGDIPADPMPWLLVVARNTIANTRRAARRRESLHEHLVRVQELAEPAAAAETTAVQRTEVLEALAVLTEVEREALLLVVWDGLSASEAAKVVGCSTATFHGRLFRARRRFGAHHDRLTDTPIPTPEDVRTIS